jgi:hypothetical protein
VGATVANEMVMAMTKAKRCDETQLPWTTGETCYLCRRARSKCDSQGMRGPDPCLGKLPGVVSACCGHGLLQGYIVFENGRRVEFELREITQVSRSALARAGRPSLLPDPRKLIVKVPLKR